MSLEIVFGLLATGLGVLITLSFQAHQKARRAVKEASAAVANANDFADLMREQYTAHKTECDQRMTKIETRIDDLASRVASLQMKR